MQRQMVAILADDLARHLVQRYRGSSLLRLFGEQALMDLSRMATKDAVRRGIDVDADIREFVEGSMDLGYRFPDDPAFAWAGDSMRGGTSAYRWFSKLRIALRKRRVSALDVAVAKASEVFAGRALRSMNAEEYLSMLGAINPGKLDASAPEVLLGGCSALTTEQVQRGVTMFLFGACCDETPLWGRLRASAGGSPRTWSVIADLSAPGLGVL
ncbi:hypothetical protein WMF26_16160 [Sorangium sp. So ce185]|uniref:hypothetical protein n=1 Tax=Sorangium sp. So ce185 TaxID=3133287 RepID=UPI003F5DDB63